MFRAARVRAVAALLSSASFVALGLSSAGCKDDAAAAKGTEAPLPPPC